ncbi:hypothetical protein BDV35DRAFT_400924 [Aspergillus flavus]|nr:hypothetical protein Ao3042_04274 [Aspergillus oryzae 3.042]KAB8250581.1 hypothetical protein BDV35DRAFT_400924 [Aspergillus flavus]KDE83729.1 hypothetical protein AO1008_10263 [Aspergillus oryzae 100-8]|eukprot:EIT79219.1 hypothetical protein Ao3042_04274 [Aspergillus oryzae 3.042]
MQRNCQILRTWCQTGHVLLPASRPLQYFSSFSPAQACHSNQAKEKSRCQASTRDVSTTTTIKPALSMWHVKFWNCRSTWKRAGINTLRCLVGCTLGDFSALWMLQTYYPALGMGAIMAASMASGMTTSIILETMLLRRGVDQLSWPMAARTAMGMSMVSMVAMEAAENIVDYHLTGGVVALGDPKFWMAAAVSTTAGYLAPLPYNYHRLKKYGKACH